MRKIAAILCVVLLLSLNMGCGDARTINGTLHSTYGIFNPGDKDPDVCYRVIFGNIVWSVLLFETIIMPVYFVGWSMNEPIPGCIPYQRKEISS